MTSNDKRIFDIFKENENNKLSEMDNLDTKDFLVCLDKYYLEYRDKLNISNNITFGLEIELEHFKGSIYDFDPFEEEINKIVGNKKWDIKNDITLVHGRELATEVYNDNEKTWKDIKNVCDFSSKYLEVGKKSAGHINIGSQILGNNSLYWYRLLKLWSVYEHVIYRFSYGEYLSYFPYMLNGSKPVSDILLNRMDMIKQYVEEDAHELILNAFLKYSSLGFLKKNGISFYKMIGEHNYSEFKKDLVLEIRTPISTLDYIIWQNYVNFFVHLLLYCKSDNFNEDILDKNIYDGFTDVTKNIDNYDKIYYSEAVELCDVIFDNNKDKIYFLRQYLKSFEVSSEKFKKAKKFTMKKD